MAGGRSPLFWRASKRYQGRRYRRRLVRVFALTLLIWLPLSAAAPAASAAPLAWPLPKLSALRSWLAGPGPSPRVPRQEAGTAAGRPHQVPAAVTRAVAKAAGRTPRKGPGQLPPYAPHNPAPKKFTTGFDTVDASVNFSPTVSHLVPGGSTATSDLYRNPGGSYTRLVYAQPVNYQNTAGAWHPIDTTLAAGTDGRWHEHANSLPVSFATTAGSPALASLATGSGQQMSLGLAGAAAVSGSAAGSSAAFTGVLAGTDLLTTATRTGMNLTLRLGAASAPGSWMFPLTLNGLTAQPASGGGVAFVTAGGQVAFQLAPASLTDGKPAPQTGLPATSPPLGYRLVSDGSGQALQVSADQAWLGDPARAFPLTATLQFTAPPAAGQASSQVLAGHLGAPAGGPVLPAGSPDGGRDAAAAVLSFPAIPPFPTVRGARITSAALHILGTATSACRPGSLQISALSQPAATSGQPASGQGSAAGTWQQAGRLRVGGCGQPTAVTPPLVPRPAATTSAPATPAAPTASPSATAAATTAAPAAAAQASATATSPAPPATSSAPSASPAPSAPPSSTTSPTASVTPAPGTASAALATQSGGSWLIAPIPAGAVGKSAGGGTAVALSPPASPAPAGTASPKAAGTSTTVVTTGVTAAATTGAGYQLLASPTAASSTPYLVVTASSGVPQITNQYPHDNYNATTLTQELRADGSDSDGDTLQYVFTIYDNTGTQVATSGLISDSDWTAPSGKLAWNKSYYWTVQAYDGTNYSATPQAYYLGTPVPQPLVTSSLSQNTGHGFSPQTQNYTTQATDAQVSTAGPQLAIDRSYNSLDPRTSGAFGAGWSSVLDMQVSPGFTDSSGNATTMVVTYPDGEQVGFGLNPGSPTTYSPPPGRFATLAPATGGGFTLTDKNDTIYTFAQALAGGAYGITSIADALKRTLTFTYNGSNQITQITSAAGRALHLTWTGSSAAHVATVATDPVTPGNSSTALTWSYSYSGDQLTSVCPPATTACTTYAYTAGTTYPQVVQNSGPHSYWQLNETSGTAAASSALINEGTDNATYSNASLGQPGPLHGSTDTAAGLDGSSSYVSLPSGLVSRASYQSIGVWFNTTGSGILFSYQDGTVASGTASSFTPTMYVGTDGYLRGEFWNGSPAPIKSSAKVNDGNWHEAVLTGAGTTQTLYLDGVKVGSVPGTIAFSASQKYDYLGTGYIGNNWPAEPNQGSSPKLMYFSGSLAQAGLWDRVLNPAEITTMYHTGSTQANLMSKVTRPSGSVYAQVSYDPASGALTQVTDENGGTWQVHPPSDKGSSQVYVGAVLGQGPADYWRLADSGAQAVNQINGGMATYNNVTLGVTGPFTDTTAASFDGSSSYVTLPTGLVDANGGQSVSLWFKATSGQAGVLFAYDSQPISAGVTHVYTPALYVGSDGKVHAEFWNGSADPVATSSRVDNGKWHHVVLAAAASSQTLYLDGVKAATLSGPISQNNLQPYTYVGAGMIGGSWPNEPYSGSEGLYYFPGSIAEVSFYNSQLSASQVATQYAASKYSGGLTPVQTVTVTDPGGKTLTYQMDPLNGNRILTETDGLGNTTKYGYDTGGFLYTTTDPNGNVVTTGHDVRGNQVSETTCQNQAANVCTSAYFSYYPDDTSASLAADPRNDMLVAEAGPGSASATDKTYLTSYAYDTNGNLTSITTPPVPGFPNGRTTATVYTTSSTPAFQNNGTTPPGLPMTVTSPGGAVTSTEYYKNGDVAQVTDPDGMKTQYTYDGIGRVLTKTEISDSFPNGLTTTYAYDPLGQVTSETDPPVNDRVTGAQHTPQISTVYDADGNVTSQTVADTTGGDASRTVSYGYNSYDQKVSYTDAAQAKTTYAYDSYGNLASQTDPATNVTGYTYDPNGHLLTTTLENYTGSPPGSQTAAPLVQESRAYDPAGRLASVTDSMGWKTSYTYTDNGLTATVVRSDPSTGASFTEESDTYNNADQLTQQVTSNGATTTAYAVDAAGRTTSQTVDPAGLDRTASYTYSPDDRVTSQTLTGPGSSTPVTSTGYSYDPMGNRTSETQYLKGGSNPDGWWRLDQASGTSVPDSSGIGNNATATNVTWSGGAGVFNGTSSQIATQAPALDTTGSFSVSAWVNLNSTSVNQGAVSQAGDSNTDSSFYLQYVSNTKQWQFSRAAADATSTSWDAVSSSSPAVTGTWAMLTGTYDAATSTMTLYVNGASQGTATDTIPFAANGPLVIGRNKYHGASANFFNGSISDVQVYQRVLTPSQVSTLYQGGRDGGAVTANQLTTKWALDQRGLPTSMTDPMNNKTFYSYDAAGQLTSTTQPPVSTVGYGCQTPTQVTPVTMTGYNTFGEPVETQDANGNTTTTAYDAAGRPTSVTKPPYTPPGSSPAGCGPARTGGMNSVTTYSYNSLGERTSQIVDPSGLANKTTWTYDQLGNIATQTAPDGGQSSYTYDTEGDQLSQTGPTGAQTTATYDYLGNQLTSTQVERYPSAASYTTHDAYNPNGWLAQETSPAGVVTKYGYNAAGEQTSVTDGAQNTTSYGYDPAGRKISTTYPDGTQSTVTFDEAGRQTGQADLASAGGTVLRSASAVYDNNGNMRSSTDYRQHTTTFTYDPTGVVASETQPITDTSSITTSFGYDAQGNRTQYIDGNGHNWWTTYNSWNLPESQIEPATTAFPNVSQGTFTATYDAAGNLTTTSEPGGVQVANTYDSMGRLTGQSGTGAEAPTATRSFTYDHAGNMLTAATAAAGNTPATSETFTYNDRGLPLIASGSAGSASLSYNSDGQVTSVNDAAGTTGYTYDSAGRLATLADPLTGTTATYSYNPLSQVSQISYGTGNNVRTFGYDNLHRLTSDVLKTSAGATVASIGYGYDANNNLTSKTTTGFAGSGSNTYNYDYANRLTSWNNGTTTTSYGYDGAGNLTQVGNQTLSYDARDQLQSATNSTATTAYAWTARGTMASAGSASYTSDAYGQGITQAGQAYTYDALGRLLSGSGGSGPSTFTYAGPGSQIASDGTTNYTYDPGGTLAAIGTAGGTTAQATIAWTDGHTDVVGDFTPTATSLTGSASYDPYGNITATGGLAGHLGYQSEFTDPATSLVHMGARWYAPGTGQFTSKDTATVNPDPNPAAANPFAYAADNPLTGTDPTGHLTCDTSGRCYVSTASVRHVHVHHVSPPAAYIPWTPLWQKPSGNPVRDGSRAGVHAGKRTHPKPVTHTGSTGCAHSPGALCEGQTRQALLAAARHQSKYIAAQQAYLRQEILAVENQAVESCRTNSCMLHTAHKYQNPSYAAGQLQEHLLNEMYSAAQNQRRRPTSAQAPANAPFTCARLGVGCNYRVHIPAGPTLSQSLSFFAGLTADAAQLWGTMVGESFGVPGPGGNLASGLYRNFAGWALNKAGVKFDLKSYQGGQISGDVLLAGAGGAGATDSAAAGASDFLGSIAPEDAGAGADSGTPIYRGLASNHNAFANAQQGIASPGDVAGHADVYAHNSGDTWTSRLTSWSTDRAVAEGFAGKNGVILQTTIEEMQARGVNILSSPDNYDEAEILLEGRIGGLQVTRP